MVFWEKQGVYRVNTESVKSTSVENANTTCIYPFFYKTTRPAMAYGAKYWSMWNKTKDGIRNVSFQEHLEVASNDDKIKENHLKWFQYVQHRPAKVLRKSFSMQVNSPQRERDRLKRMEMDLVRLGLKKSNLLEDLARIDWNGKNRIHVANSNIIWTKLWWRWWNR